MTNAHRYLLAALLAISLLAAGCGGDDDTPAAGSASGSAVPFDRAFDRAFIDGMVPHHEGAIEMAEAAKTAGLSQPELIEIADAIVETQQEEIDEMKDWRAEWFGSAEIDPSGAEALGLSEEEMGMQHGGAAISSADDVDAAFARMMTDHHNGAIAMAKQALERGEREEIKELAREIIAAQEREIAIMEKHVSGKHSTH